MSSTSCCCTFVVGSRRCSSYAVKGQSLCHHHIGRKALQCNFIITKGCQKGLRCKLPVAVDSDIHCSRHKKNLQTIVYTNQGLPLLLSTDKERRMFSQQVLEERMQNSSESTTTAGSDREESRNTADIREDIKNVDDTDSDSDTDENTELDHFANMDALINYTLLKTQVEQSILSLPDID